MKNCERVKRNSHVFLVIVIVMFQPICKLTGSANFGKVLPMKLTSYSAVQVIKFILFSSLFCKVLGGKTKIWNKEIQGTQARSYLRACNFSACVLLPTLILSALFVRGSSASRWLFLLCHYLGCKQFTKILRVTLYLDVLFSCKYMQFGLFIAGTFSPFPRFPSFEC